MSTPLRKVLFIALAATLPTTAVLATKTVVQVANTQFTPSQFNVCLGDTVQFVWVNGSHTTTSTSVPTGAVSWNVPMVGSTSIYNYVPAVTGNYQFVCTPHAPGMAGSFTVKTTPAAPVITAPNGATSCSGVVLLQGGTPSGTYIWYNGTTRLGTGATSNTFTATTSGSYTVRDSNACGFGTSNAIAVTVNTSPPNPTIGNTHAGATYTFTTPTVTGITGWQWNFGDGTAGATVQNPPPHTYTTAGAKTVSVQVTNGAGCSATGSTTITVSLGITNIGGKHPVTIAPNPAKDRVVIQTDGSKTTAVLMDAAGRTVKNVPQSVTGNDITLDVSSLAVGTYLLQLSADGATATEKIQVVR